MKKIYSIVIFFILTVNLFAGVNQDLLHGAESGKIKIVKKAIEKGAAINAKDSRGWAALIRDKYGMTSLMIASMSAFSQLSVIKYLIKKGADVNAKCNNGKNALYYARQRKKKKE